VLKQVQEGYFAPNRKAVENPARMNLTLSNVETLQENFPTWPLSAARKDEYSLASVLRY
jgi:hypothetical protein